MGALAGALAKRVGKGIEKKMESRLKNPGSKGGGGEAQASLNDAPNVVNKIQIKRGSKNNGSKY